LHLLQFTYKDNNAGIYSIYGNNYGDFELGLLFPSGYLLQTFFSSWTKLIQLLQTFVRPSLLDSNSSLEIIPLCNIKVNRNLRPGLVGNLELGSLIP